MTTVTGEKLRGRKRDPSVLEKAWATRRSNEAKRLREAKRAKNAARLVGKLEPVRTIKGRLKAGTRLGPIGSMILANMRTGSTKRGRKAAKAPTSRTKTGRLSNLLEDAARGRDTFTTATGASNAEGANRAEPLSDMMVGAKANWASGDDQLVGEFLSTAENAIGWGISFPMSQVQAVVRRLRSSF